MIKSKLLARQLKRCFGVEDEDELAGWLRAVSPSFAQAALKNGNRTCVGLGDFLTRIDDAYMQFDRDLDLRSRSLALSSGELNHANARLREEAAAQKAAIDALQGVAAALSRRCGVEYDGRAATLGSTTQLLLRLMASWERMEDALKSSEERFQLAVESTGLGLWDWNLATHCMFYSEEWCRLLGYRPGRLPARVATWGQLIHPDDRPGCRQELRTCLRGETAVFDRELRMRCVSGNYRWMQVRGRVVARNEQGRALRCIGIMVDISERKAAELAMAEATRAAEAANRAKSDFVANMSHEIRTPMNGIMGMTKLCLETELSDEQREYLEMVSSSARNLLCVINDILDFSKIEAGKLLLDPVDFSLRKLISETLRTSIHRSHNSELEIICDIGADVPNNLIGDPVRLRQVITNLVGNAVKFTRRGEVKLRVRLTHADQAGAGLYFEVQDTGIGIPAEKLGTIFQAFSQADSSTTRNYGGTGLGLTISSQLVSMMGGELQVESAVDLGSRFYFQLNFGISSAQEVPPAAPETLRRMQVLVVDDNETNRRLLHEMLRHFGMRPLVADSAAAGLEILRDHARFGAPIGLLLVDGNMPGMDGFTMAGNIVLDSRLDATRVIMLSSLSERHDHAALNSVGIARCLPKPIDQSELFNAILAVLGERPVAPAETSPASPATRPETTPLEVLLVEDNGINQRLATHLLEKAGHRVTLAQNGLEAVSLVAKRRFDVILMDIQMPGMSGVEATRRIRAWEQAGMQPHMPIVAMTANAMSGDRERYLDGGMDGYVSKPIMLEELMGEIERVCKLSDATVVPPQPAGMAAGPMCLDYRVALSNVGNHKALLRELAELFLRDGLVHMRELGQAVAAADADLIHVLAHGFKGEVAVFGHQRVTSLAQELETLGRLGELEQVRTVFAELEQDVVLLAADLQVLLSSEAA